MFGKKQRDTLDVMRELHKAYNDTFEATVSFISDSIKSLERQSEQLDATIQNIEEYERELGETKAGMVAQKEQTGKVIANFKKLMCIED